MKEISEPIEDLISSSEVLLLLFGDAACGPCQTLKHRIDQWSAPRPEVIARYIPISEHLEMSSQMGILGVPTICAFIDGKLTEKESGYFSLDLMLNRLERQLLLRKD